MCPSLADKGVSNKQFENEIIQLRNQLLQKLYREMYPRWLKLKEASKYASIGMKRLKRLALERVIKGFPDPENGRHDWIFDRLSLDAYREGQMSDSTCEDKVRAILKTVPV
jgi:hypothetical protein